MDRVHGVLWMGTGGKAWVGERGYVTVKRQVGGGAGRNDRALNKILKE